MLPFNAGLASLAISLVLLLPGVGVMDVRGFSRTVPFGSIVLFAASLFLARAVEHYRVLDPVAEGFFAALNVGALNPTLFAGVVVALAMLLHVAFTSTTVYATVVVPIVLSLTQLKQLPPALVGLPVAFLAPIAVILPVNTIPNLVFFKEGWFTERQLLEYGLALSLVSTIIVLAVGVPYWRLIGLL
jgi:di/tricarboxylate transporter